MSVARHLPTVLTFPVEIWWLVFQHVDDSRTLANLTLFHRTLRPIVEDLLYRCVTLIHERPIICLSTTLRAHPRLGFHVRAFHIHLARDRDAEPSLINDSRIILSSLHTILRGLPNIVDLTLSVEALWDPIPPWDLSPSIECILALRFPRLRTFVCHHPGYIPSGASLLGTAVAGFVGAHSATLKELEMPLVNVSREAMEHLCPPVLVPHHPQATISDVTAGPAARLLALRILACHWLFFDKLLQDQVRPLVLDRLTHLHITHTTSRELNRVARLSSASFVSLRIGGPLRALDAQAWFNNFLNDRPGENAGPARFPHLQFIQVDAPSPSAAAYREYTQGISRLHPQLAPPTPQYSARTRLMHETQDCDQWIDDSDPDDAHGSLTLALTFNIPASDFRADSRPFIAQMLRRYHNQSSSHQWRVARIEWAHACGLTSTCFRSRVVRVCGGEDSVVHEQVEVMEVGARLGEDRWRLPQVSKKRSTV